MCTFYCAVQNKLQVFLVSIYISIHNIQHKTMVALFRVQFYCVFGSFFLKKIIQGSLVIVTKD